MGNTTSSTRLLARSAVTTAISTKQIPGKTAFIFGSHRNTHPHRRLGGLSGGPSTRSHPELGRETLLRQWYFGLSRGRVGRRQVFHEDGCQKTPFTMTIPPIKGLHSATLNLISVASAQNTNNAGWSSQVARQAHNLKVRGSNPLPATK